MTTANVKFVVNNNTSVYWLPGTQTIDHGYISPSSPPNIVPQAQNELLFTAKSNFGVMGDEGSLTYNCGATPSDQFTLWWDQRWAKSSGPGVDVNSSNYDITYKTSFDGESGTYTVNVSIAPKSQS